MPLTLHSIFKFLEMQLMLHKNHNVRLLGLDNICLHSRPVFIILILLYASIQSQGSQNRTLSNKKEQRWSNISLWYQVLIAFINTLSKH